MTTHPHGIVINISRFDLAQICLERYHRLYVDNQSEEGDQQPLAFGTGIHAALESLYKGLPDPSVADALKAFSEAYTLPEVEGDLTGYGHRMIEGYWEKYGEEDSAMKALAVEDPVVVKLAPIGTGYPEPIYLLGRPDLYGELTRGGAGYWHVQTKTCHSNTSFDLYVQAYNMNWHEPGYALLGEQLLGAAPRGTILNILRKTKAIQTKTEHTFQRHYIPVTPFRIEQFKRALFYTVQQIVDGQRIQSTNACRSWNRLCPYAAACQGLPVFGDTFAVRSPDYVDLAQEVVDSEGDITMERLRELLQETR